MKGQKKGPPQKTMRAAEFAEKMKRRKRRFTTRIRRAHRKMGGLGVQGEEHVAGGLVATAAVIEVEDQVVFGDEITRGETQFGGGALNGGGKAFPFTESDYGSFVQFNKEASGPFVAGGGVLSAAEFFLGEPT